MLSSLKLESLIEAEADELVVVDVGVVLDEGGGGGSSPHRTDRFFELATDCAEMLGRRRLAPWGREGEGLVEADAEDEGVEVPPGEVNETGGGSGRDEADEDGRGGGAYEGG